MWVRDSISIVITSKKIVLLKSVFFDPMNGVYLDVYQTEHGSIVDLKHRMKKEVNITYIKEWALTDGIHRPIHGYAKVGTLFTKHYHSAIFLLAGLNASSRDLLEF